MTLVLFIALSPHTGLFFSRFLCVSYLFTEFWTSCAVKPQVYSIYISNGPHPFFCSGMSVVCQVNQVWNGSGFEFYCRAADFNSSSITSSLGWGLVCWKVYLNIPAPPQAFRQALYPWDSERLSPLTLSLSPKVDCNSVILSAFQGRSCVL